MNDTALATTAYYAEGLLMPSSQAYVFPPHKVGKPAKAKVKRKAQKAARKAQRKGT